MTRSHLKSPYSSSTAPKNNSATKMKKKNTSASSIFSGFPTVVPQPLPYPITAVAGSPSNGAGAKSKSRASIQGGAKRAEPKKERKSPIANKPPWRCTHPGCKSIIYYARNFDINRHREQHLPDELKPYHCEWPGCTFCTTQKRNLDSHVRTHYGEEAKLTCTIREDGVPCTFKYTDPSSLTRHRQRVHGYLTREEKRMLESGQQVAKTKATIKARQARAKLQARKAGLASPVDTQRLEESMQALCMHYTHDAVSPSRASTSASSDHSMSPVSSPDTSPVSPSIPLPYTPTPSLSPPSSPSSSTRSPSSFPRTASYSPSPAPVYVASPQSPSASPCELPAIKRCSFNEELPAIKRCSFNEELPLNTWPPPLPRIRYAEPHPIPKEQRPCLPSLSTVTGLCFPSGLRRREVGPALYKPAYHFGNEASSSPLCVRDREWSGCTD